MLEIYNETLRDQLSTNKSTFDASRVENSAKQYAIKHDANGNTYVSHLTRMGGTEQVNDAYFKSPYFFWNTV